MRGYSQGSCRLQKSYRRTDIKCLSNGRKNLITLKDQTTKMYQSSRKICLRKAGEICINHFVEIIFTLSCAVVDINLLQINCSKNFLLKICKKKLYRHSLVDINNINVPRQRICSHFLVQIPRADAEIVTNKLPLLFFY